jgi:hypothetical protein
MKITAKGIVPFCGVDWLYLPQDTVQSPATLITLTTGLFPQNGEELFEEISDCNFLKSDYDQWIQVSRAHPTERVKQKSNID